MPLVGRSWERGMMSCTRLQKLRALKLACEALAELHAHGIVHRDISPDNICTDVADVTQPVIVDMGLLLLPGDMDPTPGACKQAYMSPEAWAFVMSVQATLKRGVGALNAQSDAWAMGLTMAGIWADMGMTAPKLMLERLQQKIQLPAVETPQQLAELFAAWDQDFTKDVLRLPQFELRGEPLYDVVVGLLHPDPMQRSTAAQAAKAIDNILNDHRQIRP
jgi:serine/threonine protein kinase